MAKLKFVDLFAGMGGFHRALSDLGHECVFAAEIDDELRELYAVNFPSMKSRVFGDIRDAKTRVPKHDILCAGFPCQPFSKSGFQLGARDETRGTLFHEILEILQHRRPPYVILENVGNFARHDQGRTWKIVRRRLEALDYQVLGTEHVTPAPENDWRDSGLQSRRSTPKRLRPSPKADGGGGLLSPHHFGEPHHRERFFVVASLRGLPVPSLPPRRLDLITSLNSVVQSARELSSADLAETRLTPSQLACIDLWDNLVSTLPDDLDFPSCPIWGDELLFDYPYTRYTPSSAPLRELRECFGRGAETLSRAQLLARLPRYAQEDARAFRQWKINFIARNREWWAMAKKSAPKGWRSRLSELPPSFRKLEWNVKGGERDIWQYVLQFRPSGLRVKRYSSSPALVAMTATQIPILGPERRFLTRTEGLRLQGFPDSHSLPRTRAAAFKALGNGVHVAVARAVASGLLMQPRDRPAQTLPLIDVVQAPLSERRDRERRVP